MTVQKALPRVLCVDDDPDILSGLKLQLRSDFNVCTAGSGIEGLTRLEEDGPFEVVVSDMCMPNMDGAQFLTKVKRISPTSIRILLTGYADVDAAKTAINEGSIFRFLMKPCARNELVNALNEAVEQGCRLDETQKLLVQSSQLKKHNNELKSEIMNDMLLGIGSRQLMNISMDYTQNTAIDHQIPYSIALFSIENFEAYKKLHGPQASIKGLQTLAAHTQHMINNTGKLFRYDDQKILLLLNDVVLSDAKVLADYVVNTFKDQNISHRPNEDETLNIKASVGSCDLSKPNGYDWHSVLQKVLKEFEVNT